MLIVIELSSKVVVTLRLSLGCNIIPVTKSFISRPDCSQKVRAGISKFSSTLFGISALVSKPSLGTHKIDCVGLGFNIPSRALSIFTSWWDLLTFLGLSCEVWFKANKGLGLSLVNVNFELS